MNNGFVLRIAEPLSGVAQMPHRPAGGHRLGRRHDGLRIDAEMTMKVGKGIHLPVTGMPRASWGRRISISERAPGWDLTFRLSFAATSLTA